MLECFLPYEYFNRRGARMNRRAWHLPAWRMEFSLLKQRYHRENSSLTWKEVQGREALKDAENAL
jgi:hypothetical protein